MNTERLQILIDHLKTIKNYDHEKWFYADNRESCGTATCALGHCLTLWPDVWTASSNMRSYIPHTARSRYPYTAAADFFGITEMQSLMVFGLPPLSPIPTLQQVIQKLERLIHEPETAGTL